MERQRRLPGLEERSRKRHATKAQLCPEGGCVSAPDAMLRRHDVPAAALRLYMAYLKFLPGESQTWVNPLVDLILNMTAMAPRTERKWKAWLDSHDFIERFSEKGSENWLAFVHPDEWPADLQRPAEADEPTIGTAPQEAPAEQETVRLEQCRIEQNAAVLRDERIGMAPKAISRLASTPGLTPLGLALMVLHAVKGPTDIGSLAGWLYDGLVKRGQIHPTRRWGAKEVCDVINDGWLRKLEAWDFYAPGVEVKYNDQGVNIHHAGGVDTISLERLRQLAGEPTAAERRAATTKSRLETGEGLGR